MSIEYAILGVLSWKPATGYELKKIFEKSTIMYWSGNNNQIYKALIQLQDLGFVTGEVVHQDSSPSKKIYTITKGGLAEFKEWLMSSPEAPEFKKSFLIQLAWSDLLNNQELNELLSKYENELKTQLLIHLETSQRALHSPKRNAREIFLWDMIFTNILSTYQNELDWVQKVQKGLADSTMIEGENKLNYRIVEKINKKYIELFSVASPFSTEQDALDLIALCGEADTNLLILHHASLSEDFFRLKTGVAGKILQKFINYQIKAAAIIPNSMVQEGPFREMAIESNRHNHFRIFENKEKAEEWLLR